MSSMFVSINSIARVVDSTPSPSHSLSTLGRPSEADVILTRHLGEALIRLNPGLPDAAYQDALRQITDAPLASRKLACTPSFTSA